MKRFCVVMGAVLVTLGVSAPAFASGSFEAEILGRNPVTNKEWDLIEIQQQFYDDPADDSLTGPAVFTAGRALCELPPRYVQCRDLETNEPPDDAFVIQDEVFGLLGLPYPF
jgi:hypothetical protein